MFCPECGTNQPDGTQFCAECGAKFEQAAPTANVRPGILVNKKEYISTMATPNTKKIAKLLPILVVVCIVVMIFGHISMLHTSIEDIPAVSMLLGDDKDEFEDAKDELDDLLDDVKDTYKYYEDEIEDELDKKELKFIDQLFDDMKACTKTFSISNMKNLIKTVEKVSDTDAADYLDLDDDFDELEEIIAVFDGLTTGMLIASLMSLLFTIIGGLCRVKGLVIAGLIFSTIFCFLMYGWLFVILNAAAHIVLIKFMGDVDKEYKAYRASVIAAA